MRALLKSGERLIFYRITPSSQYIIIEFSSKTWKSRLTLVRKIDYSSGFFKSNAVGIITKNHAADPEIRFLTKSISKPNGYGTAIPTAWELRKSIC